MKLNTVFTGFDPKAIQFLHDLKLNNNREWFAENKSIYKDYLESGMMNLFEAISETMSLIDPLFYTEPKPAKVLSRIYRDIRFSKDKSPYRTNAWLTFKCDVKDWKICPAYFFELSEEHIAYGMGFYEANKSSMDNLRNRIDEESVFVMRLVDNIKKETDFSIEGDKYKKILNPNIQEPLIPIYQSKNLYLIQEHPINDSVFNGDLQFRLMEQFLKTSEFYHFLNL